MYEALHATGTYLFECYDALGRFRWRALAPNVVTIVGRNFALDTYLSGVGYTVTGPYIGLIASNLYTGVSVTDTMASHPGWLEAGISQNPHIASGRGTPTFAAASAGSKATAATASFNITSDGTLKGGFLVFGPGATNVIESTTGTLYSAGLFVGGDQLVHNADTLNVSYTASLT